MPGRVRKPHNERNFPVHSLFLSLTINDYQTANVSVVNLICSNSYKEAQPQKLSLR